MLADNNEERLLCNYAAVFWPELEEMPLKITSQSLNLSTHLWEEKSKLLEALRLWLNVWFCNYRGNSVWRLRNWSWTFGFSSFRSLISSPSVWTLTCVVTCYHQRSWVCVRFIWHRLLRAGTGVTDGKLNYQKASRHKFCSINILVLWKRAIMWFWKILILIYLLGLLSLKKKKIPG